MLDSSVSSSNYINYINLASDIFQFVYLSSWFRKNNNIFRSNFYDRVMTIERFDEDGNPVLVSSQ